MFILKNKLKMYNWEELLKSKWNQNKIKNKNKNKNLNKIYQKNNKLKYHK